MARIDNFGLADAGRRRRATFTASGTIVWEDTDISRNAVEVRVSFFGQDRGADERIANNVVNAVKGRSERVEEGRSVWTLTAEGAARTDFVLRRDNSDDVGTGRGFNEDRPGRDEVYAMAVLRDPADASNLSDWVRSNTVTGRY